MTKLDKIAETILNENKRIKNKPIRYSIRIVKVSDTVYIDSSIDDYRSYKKTCIFSGKMVKSQS